MVFVHTEKDKLCREVEEERRLSESLASRDVVDSEELNKIRELISL